MLNKHFILTTLLFIICVLSTSAQDSFVKDSTAKRLQIKEAVKKTYFGENKTASYTYTDFYNRSGKLIKRISVDHNSISNKQLYFYNKIGKLIKERNISFDKDDSTIYTLKFLYNIIVI